MYAGDSTSSATESKIVVIVVPTVVLGVLIIITVILISIYVRIKIKKRKQQEAAYPNQSTEIPTISDKNNDITNYCYVQYIVKWLSSSNIIQH